MSLQHTLGIKDWKAGVAAAPYLLVLFTFAYATMFAFAQTDDFCTFGRLLWMRDGNPLAETWYLYQNWTGRYASTFAIAGVGWAIAVLPVPDYWVYSASLSIFLAILVLSLHRLLNAGSGFGFGPMLGAAILGAAVLLLMPSKLEGLLWLTGVSVYTLGISFLLLASVEMRRDLSSDGLGWGVSWRSLALLFFVSGFNELLTASVAVLVFANIVAYRQRKFWPQHLAFVGVFIVSCLTTALAPGNFARDALSTAVRHDLNRAAQLSGESLRVFLEGQLLPDAGALLLIALACVAAGALAGRGSDTKESRRPSHWLPLVAALIPALVMHAPLYSFLTGEAIPGRVVNQGYIMGILGLGIGAYWIGSMLPEALHTRFRPLPAILVIGVALLTTSDFQLFSSILRDDAPAWRSQNLERREILADARASAAAHVDLDPFAVNSSLWSVFQGGDVTTDKGYWVNSCVAGYYRVPSVSLPTSPERLEGH